MKKYFKCSEVSASAEEKLRLDLMSFIQKYHSNEINKRINTGLVKKKVKTFFKCK